MSEPEYVYVKGSGWVLMTEPYWEVTDSEGVRWRVFRRDPKLGDVWDDIGSTTLEYYLEFVVPKYDVSGWSVWDNWREKNKALYNNKITLVRVCTTA